MVMRYIYPPVNLMLFHQRQGGRNEKLITYLHGLRKLRMCGAFTSRRPIQIHDLVLMHRNKSTRTEITIKYCWN
jgi:hypothetical protein